MEGLPEVFDRSDLLGRLNPPPERSSLYKVFQELVYDNVIEQVEGGHGMYPNRYRRLVPTEDEEAQG
jgi:hypothetical protein